MHLGHMLRALMMKKKNYEAYVSHWFPQKLLMNITISHSFIHS